MEKVNTFVVDPKHSKDFTCKSPSMLSSSLIESSTLRIADWVSEFSHHAYHSHQQSLPTILNNPLKITFPKKPQTSSNVGGGSSTGIPDPTGECNFYFLTLF